MVLDLEPRLYDSSLISVSGDGTSLDMKSDGRI